MSNRSDDATPGRAARHDVAAARLHAARVFGAVAVGLIGQFAVSMPAGYFGPADVITSFGVFYSIGIVLALSVVVGALWRHSRWGLIGSSAIFAVNVGLFIPPLPENPVIAGLAVIWNFYLLSRTLLAVRPRRTVREREFVRPGSPEARWLRHNGPGARHVLAVALLATVAVVGYGIGARVPAQAVCLALQATAIVVSAGYLRRLFASSRWSVLGALLILAAAAATAAVPPASLVILAAFDAWVLISIAVRSELFPEVLHHFYSQPALLVLVSFVVLIALGTVLLTFPAASARPAPIEPVDALFTATSAACVTGLIVLDTPRDFSFFGHLVILGLIQVGGLNIMVLSAFAALLLGRGLGLRGEQALGAMLELPSATAAYRLIGFIVVSTLLVEGVGALVLGAAEIERGTAPLTAVWRGLFHAVSAFCNAGFALYSDSLVSFQDQPLVLLVMATLITLGGLGFAVLAFSWLRLGRSAHIGLATQVRIVLLASAALTSFGFIAIAVGEWQRGLAGLGTVDKLVNALFQSVTCRTAGFNSVAIDALHPATLMLMMALMFIGASPGGTGGGIKTTTLVVLLSAIPAIASGHRRVSLLRRTISLETVFRSTAIAVVGALVVFFGATSLLVLQSESAAQLVFETVSAFGTVGLSRGATSGLETPGKLVVVLLMLVGRIGPLSLAVLFGRKRASAVRHPEARIMVG